MTARLSFRHRRKLKEAVSCETMAAKTKKPAMFASLRRMQQSLLYCRGAHAMRCGWMPVTGFTSNTAGLHFMVLRRSTSERYHQESIMTWRMLVALPTHVCHP